MVPSVRTLRSYRNVDEKGSGWQAKKFLRLEELKKLHKLAGADLEVGLAVDEMKISEGLVWNSNGEIVGIEDDLCVEPDFRVLESLLHGNEHKLQVQLSSITTAFDFYLGWFPTTNIRARPLYNILDEAHWRQLGCKSQVLENVHKWTQLVSHTPSSVFEITSWPANVTLQ
mmetsp:Transcript_24140/g.33853  ORF Transcript_24140/g.33853 Transcript_24140/m.33853 type:complete len:171 (-) Transcript_24140:136-648(-)